MAWISVVDFLVSIETEKGTERDLLLIREMEMASEYCLFTSFISCSKEKTRQNQR